jgi:hypothetical protein
MNPVLLGSANEARNSGGHLISAVPMRLRWPAPKLVENTTRGESLMRIQRFVSRSFVLLVAPLISAQTSSLKPADTAQLAGYTVTSSKSEHDWEKKFLDGVVSDNVKENMRRLSARPHHVGSPYDKDNAEWILGKFKEWGFDAHIETFNVLFPTPKERVVELLEPTRFKAKLQEPAVPADPTSGQTSEQLPTYNAYSIDGDVTAPLVYVNYGTREDYEQLDRLGISVKGAIVIARYGAAWRGIKPKVAAQHGAAGCIIYSDPRDDGYFEGDEYPNGGWRPREGVQRGSVMDTDYPGDPLTPGVGATAMRSGFRSARRRRSRKFLSCRFRMGTLCRCFPLSAARLLQSHGEVVCRSLITLGRAQRRFI